MQTNDLNFANTGYLVNDTTVAALARAYADARGTIDNVKGAYLRVLVAHAKDLAAKAQTRTPESDMQAMLATHDRLYAIVLAAITTPDIAADDAQPKDERQRRALERNRRSTFARTAKSTLQAYLKAGGSLPDLDPNKVTKESLRVASPPARPPETSATILEKRIEDVVKAMAELDREKAITFIDDLHTRLLLIVARPITHGQMRKGELTLTPSH